MNILANCSFSEFNSSDFMEYFVKEENNKYVFKTSDAKLVFCSEDCGFGEYLHTFYDKSNSYNSRWYKRLDLSNEQLEEVYVYLVGDDKNDPIEIVMEVGATLIVFSLTEEMKEYLIDAKRDEQESFPNW